MQKLHKHPHHTNKINHYFKTGLAGANWYDETRHHVLAKIGAQDTPLFIDMLAATSPNQSVAGNESRSARIWGLYHRYHRPVLEHEKPAQF